MGCGFGIYQATIGVSVAFPKLQLYHLYNEDVTQLNHTTGKKEIKE